MEEILFEDKELLVVYKRAGIAVQTRRVTEQDLESRVKNYLAQKDPGKKPGVHVIHRLDQPVEGIVLFAKTKKTAAALERQLAEGEMEKIYHAVTDGTIPAGSGVLKDRLQKDAKTNRSHVVSEGGKLSELSYRKIGPEEVEITLLTGRHHQIRVQLAHAGMPVRGDRKYGLPGSGRGYAPLMLAEAGLAFVHPADGRKMDFSIIPWFDQKN
ncbi:MAG: RNA pseudouridine synthase [Lachnospiraceae bacterium]|nr:RNA pseudouridine synthase [Lachnospiraceae bacterium]